MQLITPVYSGIHRRTQLFMFQILTKAQAHYLNRQLFSSLTSYFCYISPEDTRSSAAHYSFHPAISLCLLTGILRFILPESHGGPFVSAPNLIIPTNASITGL